MALVVLDVNETLSDLAPLADVMHELGAPPALAQTWFAATLRDGFALTVVGENPAFVELARAVAVSLLAPVVGDGAAGAADRLLDALTSLPVHDDVVPGLRALGGHRVVTLSNGAPEVAHALLARAGAADLVEQTLSVQDAGRWKPHPDAYGYAARACGAAAAELTLVAVHPWDIDGAHRAGLRTAYLDRTGAPYPPHFAAPDIRLSALPELVDALR